MEITPDILITAYSQGYFPMAVKDGSEDVHWVMPDMRGILPIAGLHIPRSLLKRLKKRDFDVTVDRAFERVIRSCALVKKGREQTWINGSIIQAYVSAHQAGMAHSIEIWQQGFLVGGLYGLKMGAAFFGESMFSKRKDMSKIALVHLAARLWAGGYTLLDAQFPNPHLDQFGAYEQSHEDYMLDLQQALSREAEFYPSAPDPCASGESGSGAALSSSALLDLFLHSRSQTS